MRFCNNCKRITRGEPLFCNYCGSTYDIKVCHARHQNPRSAEFCFQCGSRDFSNPAPELSPVVRAIGPILRYGPGLALTVVSIELLWILSIELLGQPFIKVQLAFLIIFTTLCWLLYIKTVDFVQHLLDKSTRPQQHGRDRPNNRH